LNFTTVTMGKPSINSRKSSRLRKKKREINLIKQKKSKEEELEDLQIQMIDFKRNAENAGEKILYEINKCSRENNNLVNWLKLYDEQITNYQKEIYNLNLKLYFSSSSQQQSQSVPPSPKSQPQLQSQPQSPIYKSLADYFSNQK
jgi:hypothetical protein